MRVAAARWGGFIVVLEDVHDPHNAEAVLRSCDAFGVQEVHFVFETVERFNPRRVGKSTSSSANKWLDFKVHNSIENCLSLLREDGYTIVATTCEDKAEDIFSATFLEEKIALVFGNEHRGVSERAISLSDRCLLIPMRGMVQSLNISVAAAISVYEVARQRLATSDSIYHLDTTAKESLIARMIYGK